MTGGSTRPGPRDARHLTQSDYSFRFDWGIDGLTALAPHSDIVIIVDVLRFTSAVCAAIESGCTVVPQRWNHIGAAAVPIDDAIGAGPREAGGASLSPTDLLNHPGGGRIVLPSPNGATLACAARDAGATRVLAGSLRNASATARFARATVGPSGSIAVIAAGERWHPEGDADTSGPLRPAIEDLLGSGAILAALDPSGAVARPRCSPEANAARVAYLDARPRMLEVISTSGSGRELIARGWDDDVATSAAIDVATVVAELIGDEFAAVR